MWNLVTEMSTEELVNMLINDLMGYTVDCEQDDDLKMDFSDDSSLEEVSIALRLEAMENYRQSQILTGCPLSDETLWATLSVGDSYRKFSESHQCLSFDEYLCRRRYSFSCI